MCLEACAGSSLITGCSIVVKKRSPKGPRGSPVVFKFQAVMPKRGVVDPTPSSVRAIN